MENIFVEFLPPWVETGLQPAFYDKESGTVLQQTARMYARVNMLIRMFNKLSKNTKEVVEEYITKFNELHDYVYDYFDNLDVQEEINNKMDELVEDGTLQRILNSPATTENLGGVIVGDGLQIDENGKLDVKAGSNITVDENGVSETPYQNYLDISINETRYVNSVNETDTYIHYAIIPNTYKPMMAMSDPNNPNVGKRANEIDYIYKPTLMVNMSPWDTSNHNTYGPLIIDHEIKVENNLGSGTGWNRPLVGIDDNGRMHNINGSTPASEVNMKYASRAWTTIYNDGDVNPDISTMTSHDPRTFVGQDYDGNYIVGVCGGRQAEDTGMTMPDILDFVTNTLSFNARLLWNYDGGGSSNFLYHGIRQNRLVEREDRACPTWLYWASPTAKHPEMFKNQSITSLDVIKREVDEDGHIQNKAGMDALNTAGSERITINSGSRYMIVNPRTVVYNLNFAITGEGNLSSYSDLFKNLPRTDSNYYFMALKHSDYSLVPVYITSMEGVDRARIRSLRAMEPGTYSIHFAVQCNTQY
jgi:exopolysaccharide biosynthesis protein